MHDFFRRREEPSEFFEVPRRAYALLIDAEDREYALSDAVDAHSFHRLYSPESHYPDLGNLRDYPPGSWRQHVDRAPIYAIEINAREPNYPEAAAWHQRHPLGSLPAWSEINLEPDPKGEAAVYNNIAGLPQRTKISVRSVAKSGAGAGASDRSLAPYCCRSRHRSGAADSCDRPDPRARRRAGVRLCSGQLRRSCCRLCRSRRRCAEGQRYLAELDERQISGLAVAHHGGRSPGQPPTKPGGLPRAAFSYGCSNGYGHPLPNSIRDLRNALWTIGHSAPGIDERRTEDRPGGKGGAGLGHIRMNWTGNTGAAHSCTCGCTLNPTQ